MIKLINRTAFFQWVSVLLVVVPLLVVGVFVWQKHDWAVSRLAELEPKHARLQGLHGIRAELEAIVREEAALVVKYAYPANMDATQAGNDAQQRIRAAFVDSRNSVESIQVLGSKDVEGFQRIGIVVHIEGVLPDIQESLLKLHAQTPFVLVDTASFQSLGPVRPASVQRLTGVFNFSVLRVRS